MAARVIRDSLRRLGQIQVFEWDFRTILPPKSEGGDPRLTGSFKRLGRIQVFEWDLKDVLPAIKKTANKELDVTSFIARAAQIEVFEWDFRSIIPSKKELEPVHVETSNLARPSVNHFDRAKMQAVTTRLKNFLQYVAVNLIDEPSHAQIKVVELGPNRVRFKLVLVKRDVAMLIGRNGFTASAIRSILKAAAEQHGIQALLQIHSHEEETELLLREEAQQV